MQHVVTVSVLYLMFLIDVLRIAGSLYHQFLQERYLTGQVDHVVFHLHTYFWYLILTVTKHTALHGRICVL